jgi:hypothetical protein
VAENEIETYLNDHLGGAMLGSDLASQLAKRSEGTPRGESMKRLAEQIQEDRETLLQLLDAVGASRNPVKQAGGWLAEKATRIKFSGAGAGDADHGLFMALETLRLGVAGKKCLWLALREVRGAHPELSSVNLDALIERATAQERELERERIAVARAVLG